jgi:uncharacterized protein YndB with AHSA1/START domain
MTDTTSVRIERIIDAPAEAVFRAWTDPEAMLVWYAEGGDDPVVRVVEHDLRVGGAFCVEFGPRGGEPFVESGIYLEIDPPRLLVMANSLRGPDVEGWSETRVTVEFNEVDGKTRLVLTHEGFTNPDTRDNVANGWPGFIDRLERLLTNA